MYNPEIGSQITHNGRQVIRTERDRYGVAVYGPYVTYDAGRYLVDFYIGIEKYDASYRDIVVAMVEVTSENGKSSFARSQIYASRLLRDQRLTTLGFMLAEPTQLEFRVHVTGRASLLIGLDRNVEKIEASTEDYSPMLPRLAHGQDKFFQENIRRLRHMFESGTSLNVTDKGTVASFGDIQFYMRSIEDFQLINEIFLDHDYNFTTARLDETGLLRKVHVLILKWHKWWSSSLTWKDIVERLKANGFTVFDQTRPDLSTGQLYAVRSTR